MALRINIIANFAGRGWQALLSLAVVPIYLKLMGAESYGLIGFFASIQAVISLLDLGLGGALCRELARSSDDQQAKHQPRDIVRTLEMIYWCIGIFAGLMILCLSPLIARYWLNAEQLNIEELQHVIAYMVLAIVFQWPSSLYLSGLIGMQRQVLVNVIGIASSTIRVVGSFFVIWLLVPSIEVFFLWQIFAAIFQTGVSRWLLWLSLAKVTETNRPQFNIKIFQHIWKFAGSLSATSVVIILLGQIDKLMLSAILPLRIFGFYMLANTIAQSINMLSAPITDAMFPRYAQLAAQDKNTELFRLFHRSCQFVVGLVFPLASVLAFFSKDVLWLWTRDMVIAQETSQVAMLLIIGVVLNTVMSMLDTLQMAFGWMKPAFYSRLAALLTIGPLMWFFSNEYGMLGAAGTWIIIFTGYLLVTPFFVFKRILRTEKLVWYRNWGSAFVISFSVAGLLANYLPRAGDSVVMFVEIIFAWILTFSINASCSPVYRNFASETFSYLAKHKRKIS